jgi:hypothetical protein
LNNDGVI